MNLELILISILCSVVATLFALLTYLAIHNIKQRKETQLLRSKLSDLDTLSKKQKAQFLQEKKELLEKLIKNVSSKNITKEVEINETDTSPSVFATSDSSTHSTRCD